MSEDVVTTPVGRYVIEAEKGMGLDFGRPGDKMLVHGYNGILYWEAEDGTRTRAASASGLYRTAKAAKLAAGRLRYDHQNYLTFNGERLEVARDAEQKRWETARKARQAWIEKVIANAEELVTVLGKLAEPPVGLEDFDRANALIDKVGPVVEKAVRKKIG